MKKRISMKLYQQDWMPGFAGYVEGSVKKPHATILLNVGSIMAMLKSGDIKKKEIPYFVAETLMHEIIHVLEEWAEGEFNHRKLNALLKKYEQKYTQTKKRKS